MCVPGSDGRDIYDVWESEQHMQAFTGKLTPVAEGLGISGPGGQPGAVSVHNYWIP